MALKWFDGSVAAAISAAKSKNAIFMVFIEGKDEQSEKMVSTYGSDKVGKKLQNAGIVAIKIKSDSVEYQQFSQIYPVVMIPSSYFISTNGIPLEIIGGFIDTEDLCIKLDKIISSESASLASTSGRDTSTTSIPKELPKSSTITDPQNKPADDIIVPSISDQELKENMDKIEKEKKVERAKELIKIQRETKLKEQQEEAKQKEIRRMKDGQNLQKFKQMQQEEEAKKVVEDIAKEKADNNKARDEVKKQIAKDRQERAAKYEKEKQELEKLKEEKLLKLRKELITTDLDKMAQNGSRTRIQFRLPDGSCVNETFSYEESLENLRKFISQRMNVHVTSFNMSTTFPRRLFEENDYSQSVKDLQLIPSSVIVIIPSKSVVPNAAAVSSNIFWTLLKPIFYIYQMVANFLFGAPSQQQSSQNESTNRKRPQQPLEDGPSTSKERVHKRRSTASSSVKIGSINKFRNSGDDDDDENNTWNGNSTQQM